jgi:hypothetical protein
MTASWISDETCRLVTSSRGDPLPPFSVYRLAVRGRRYSGRGGVARGRRIFDTLAEGGRVNMPFEKTFWASAFGMLVDRFGTPWMVSGPAASA